MCALSRVDGQATVKSPTRNPSWITSLVGLGLNSLGRNTAWRMEDRAQAQVQLRWGAIRTCYSGPQVRMRRFAVSAGPSCRKTGAATSAAIASERVDIAKSLVVKAMYERIFVAGILAGFEDTLEALIPGVWMRNC